MIFYFSGTGNSLWVARQLADTFNERLISIADELKNHSLACEYSLLPDEKIFFVFPVHSWGPSVLSLRFVNKIKFKYYSNHAAYLICTCGDNCGYTSKILENSLRKQSINLIAAYSIQMPNNYILMKGFGIDPKGIEEQKLKNAPGLLQDVIDDIRTRKGLGVYVTGSKPFLKSRIVYPLFKKFAIRKNSFYAKENCISCGLCEEICPTQTISLVNGKPIWNNTCVQCTACIHRCPVCAIEFGKITQDQGRYIHPDLA